MSYALKGHLLPRWSTGAFAASAIALSLLINQTTAVQGVAGTATLAATLFLVLQTAVSYAVEGRRHAKDRLATTVIGACFVGAAAPLLSVLWLVVSRGAGALSADFLLKSQRNQSGLKPGGGLYHALIGTVQQVTIAAAVAVPLGILCAIYLVEYGRSGRLARWISFFVDVMTGLPSIVAGLFIYTSLVLTLGMPRSGFASSLALAILMLPVIVRTSEEMLRLVPNDLREASLALGIPKWRTVLRVVLPTAISGIITGVMLAVARVSGETAPLLLTTFLSQSINNNPFNGPQAAVPTFVWDQLGSGTEVSIGRAWGGALVLITLVMVSYASAKFIAHRYSPKA